MHGGAAGQVRGHLPGRGLEYLHGHPEEECAQPAGLHRRGPNPPGAPAHIHHRQHDRRYQPAATA